MGVTVQWDNPEKTVIYYQVDDEWDWADLHRLIDVIFSMLDERDHVVDAIAEFKTVVTFKAGMLTEGRRLLLRRHPANGITVVVTPNPLFRSIYNMIRQAYPRANLYSAFYFASSYEDARAMINQMRRKRQEKQEL